MISLWDGSKEFFNWNMQIYSSPDKMRPVARGGMCSWAPLWPVWAPFWFSNVLLLCFLKIKKKKIIMRIFYQKTYVHIRKSQKTQKLILFHFKFCLVLSCSFSVPFLKEIFQFFSNWQLWHPSWAPKKPPPLQNILAAALIKNPSNSFIVYLQWSFG